MAVFDTSRYMQLPSGVIVPRDEKFVEMADLAEDVRKGVADENKMRRLLELSQESSGAVFSAWSILHSLGRFGAAEKPYGTESHKALRRYARDSFLDSLIINARLIQLRHVSKRVYTQGKEKGFQVRHKRANDPDFKITKKVKDTCREIEDIIFKPRPDVHPAGFRDAVAMLVQGELVIDRKAVVTQRDRKNRVLRWHVLPPDDIKPRNEVLLKYLPANTIAGFATGGFNGRTTRGKDQGAMIAQLQRVRANQLDQALEAVFNKFDIDASNAAYLQEVDGVVLGAWDKDEITVDVTAPSDELNMFGYGLSNLERSIDVSAMLIYAWNYNKSQFLENYPEAFLTVSGGGVDQAGLDALKADIYAEVGEQGRSRLPVVNLGNMPGIKAELLKLRDSIRDLEMPQLLRMCAAFKCAAHRTHPELINLNPDRGGDRPSLIANSDEAFQIDLAQEEGLGSLVEAIATLLTRVFCEPVDEYEDYVVVAVLEKTMTEAELNEFWTKRAESISPINEARSALGMQPLETVGGVKGDYINNAFYFQAVQSQQAEMQQQMQMLQGQPQEEEQGANQGQGGQDQEEEPEQPQPGALDGFTGMGQAA